MKVARSMIFKIEYWRNLDFSRWCCREIKENFIDCLTLKLKKVVPRTFETSEIKSPMVAIFIE